MNFEIIRSPKRRRLCISLREGKVRLLLPIRFPESKAIAFLNEKSAWVERKLREYAARIPHQQKQYTEGERFAYLGEEYTLSMGYTKQPKVMLRDRQLFVLLRENIRPEKRQQQIQRQLHAWYREQANILLAKKSDHYAQALSVQYRSIQVKQFKSRWGSCSIKGDIHYTWQIMMAPDPVVDYLVVHELSHIRHHNHSPAFWETVESVMPDYKKNRRWLKENGHLLRVGLSPLPQGARVK